MKRQILALVGGLLIGGSLFAQQAPASAIPNDPANTFYWSRVGNTNGLSQNNIFGTLWNSPIYTMTNFQYHSKLNGSVSYNINGYTPSLNGYMLLGNDLQLQTGGAGSSIYRDKGAFSLLHLNGSGTQVQELGYRPWMQTGITFTGNNDLSYFGLRQIGTVNDRTETVIAWSDNPAGSIGDEMVFRFMGQSSGQTTLSSDFSSPDDIDGLHVGRFSPAGRFGLGNTFGHIDDPQSVLYNTPQSLLHMSYQLRGANEFEPYGFLQITYRRPTGATTDFPGEGELATDGFRLGIDNQINPDGGGGSNFYLNSYLRWQEMSSFVIQTESETDNNIQNNERIRVSSIQALTSNFGANYLGNIGLANRTRIGISSDGSAPVTRPMSLVHLGANVPTSSGWRNWMDIGTYTTNGNDNMYVGLKNEGGTDRQDAVINWGDNYTGTGAGPDNMRFIFTANNTGTGPAVSNDGLEGMRMTPTAATGVFTGVGGNPVGNPYGPTGSSSNPTATLEVNSWGTTNSSGGSSGLRFTNLTTASPIIANPGNGYLSVNSNGDVVYVAPSSGIGAPCGSASNIGLLNTDSRLNLNNNNFYFANLASTPNPASNRVSVGYNCTSSLFGKFNSYQQEISPVLFNTMAIHADVRDVAAIQGLRFYGIRAIAQGLQTPIYRGSNYGGYFTGTNSEVNYGVRGEAYRGNYSLVSQSYGGYFTAQNSNLTYGVYTAALSTASSGTVYGIFSTASGGALTRAGYFEGLIQTTASYIQYSDSTLKTDINKLNGSLKMIQGLKPVSFNMKVNDYPNMNLDNHLQFGYIAQDVQNVFPNLVYDSYSPAHLDTLGNPIDSAGNYKALNYIGFIPINTQAIIELNQKVDKITLSDASIKTNVQDLDSSLAKVLEMRGVSYDWNHSVHPELNLDSVNHIGFIAQEIQQIDPRLTYVADDSLLHVEYDKVVPVLAEAIQELNNEVESKDSIINVLITDNSAQQTTIDNLNARLTSLENCLSALLPTLCSLNQSLVQNNTPAQQEEVRKNLNVALNNRTAIILDQNVPNPFAEQTVINFSIPATVQKAQILFYDGNGKLMQSVDITERGLGSLTVFGSDLSFGTYTYTLVADGQIVATKKMVKQ